MAMAVKKNSRLQNAKPRRTGVPLTVYLSDDLTDMLNQTSRQRRVHKSAIVRFAVERLLSDLKTGHTGLSFGIGE